MGTKCGEQRNRLCVAQAELEELRAERERMREENWQLKEVVAKLSRDVHLGEKERRDSSVLASGDNLLDNGKCARSILGNNVLKKML